VSDIEDLFPSAADGEWQPKLPEGIKFVTLVQDAEEIKDRLFVADFSAQLEQVLAAARKRSRLHRSYSGASVLISGDRAYGISAVQYADEESPRLDLAIFEFAEHWRGTVKDLLAELLLDRADALLTEAEEIN